MNIVMRIIKMLIFIYIGFGLVLFFMQRDYMYFPSPKTSHSYPVEKFSNNGELIEVIVLNKGSKDSIIYFGGNGETVVANASSFKDTFADHTVYLVNYRGYGGSSGEPNEKALYSDAHYIYDSIKDRHEHISVIGRSLGTGVAIYLASTRIIKKMILITPYDSFQNVAQKKYPIYPMSLMLMDKYNSTSRIKDINSDTLIILADHDQIIPRDSSNKLIKLFPVSQVTLEVIKETSHNTVSHNERYYSILEEFIN